MIPKMETVSLRKDFVKPTTKHVLTALEDVNLEIMPSEFVCIVGPSHCGKTTFLRIVDGLINKTGGHIYINGKEVFEPGPDRSFVFQNDALWPWRTVLKNVVFGLEIQKVSPDEARRRAAND